MSKPTDSATPATRLARPAGGAGMAPGLVLCGLAVGLGLSLLGHFVADGVRDHKSMDRHVEVKGLAERVVEADQATWVLSYSVSGEDFDAVQADVDAQGAKIRTFLRAHDLAADTLSAGQTIVTDQSTNPYRPPNPGPRFHVQASVIVSGDDVHAVAAAAEDVNELVRAGILLAPTSPTYRFTGLNTIKPAMLAEATSNAREAAEQFAESADQSVGPIREARQGAFSIQAALASPDAYADPASSLEKRVRVVTTLDYQLE